MVWTCAFLNGDKPAQHLMIPMVSAFHNRGPTTTTQNDQSLKLASFARGTSDEYVWPGHWLFNRLARYRGSPMQTSVPLQNTEWFYTWFSIWCFVVIGRCERDDVLNLLENLLKFSASLLLPYWIISIAIRENVTQYTSLKHLKTHLFKRAFYHERWLTFNIVARLYVLCFQNLLIYLLFWSVFNTLNFIILFFLQVCLLLNDNLIGYLMPCFMIFNF